MTNQGRFDDAYEPFYDATMYLARNALKRDQRNSSRILPYLEDLSTGGIVVNMGPAHTNLMRIFRKAGYPVSWIFANAEAGTVNFGPGASLIRKIMYFGEQQITQLEWYQAIIGDAVNTLMNTYKYVGGMENISSNQIDRMSTSLAASFKDIAEVRDFELKVRKKGFALAVEEYCGLPEE